MQGKFITIDAVDEVTKGASDPVRRVSEAGTLLHGASTCAHTGLLVDRLDLPRVKHECLCTLSAKDKHISVVQLDSGDGLSTD